MKIESTQDAECVMLAQHTVLTKLNIVTKEYKQSKKYDFLRHFFAMAPGSNQLMYACESLTDKDKDLYTINRKRRAMALINDNPHVVGAAYNQTGIYIALAFSDNDIALFNTNTQEQCALFHEPEYDPYTREYLSSFENRYGISSLFFSFDSTYLFAGSIDGSIHIWKNRPWHYQGHVDFFHNRAVSCLNMSDDEKILASCSSEEEEGIMIYKNFRFERTITHAKPTCLSFFPRSHILASGGVDGNIRIWNTDTGACIHTLVDTQLRENCYITSLYVTKDSVHLLAGYNTGKLCIWNIENQPEFLIAML
jgi:WD40 repeat protein